MEKSHLERVLFSSISLIVVQFDTIKMEIDEIPIVNEPKINHILNPKDVPTIDEEVRAKLRSMGEPITYFGEGKAERRERLIKLVSELPNTNFKFAYVEENSKEEEVEGSDDDIEEDEEDEDFYTPGSEALLESRKRILQYSLQKSSERHELQKAISKKQDFVKTLKHRRTINSNLSKFALYGTQLLSGNTRTLSAVRFSSDSSLIACGSWDGSVYVLRREDLKTKHYLGPGHHTEKVSALDWDLFNNNRLIVTGGNEGTINFWTVSDTNDTEPQKIAPSATIKDAHQHRISKTLFHPTGKYVVSTSFDQTWKLWDVENSQEALVQQEGHSKEVFCGSFHPDGGLLSTGGLDAIGRIWDLRCGRSIATLQGHIKGIYSMDWSPNGYHLATVSGDCAVKIWDIRKFDNSNLNGELFSIPSHTKLVSDVRFYHKKDSTTPLRELSTTVTDEFDQNPEQLDTSGTFLASASYDGMVNIWSADNWVKVKSLKGHSDKVMSCDISGDGCFIASSGWDRSVKLWSVL